MALQPDKLETLAYTAESKGKSWSSLVHATQHAGSKNALNSETYGYNRLSGSLKQMKTTANGAWITLPVSHGKGKMGR